MSKSRRESIPLARPQRSEKSEVDELLEQRSTRSADMGQDLGSLGRHSHAGQANDRLSQKIEGFMLSSLRARAVTPTLALPTAGSQ